MINTLFGSIPAQPSLLDRLKSGIAKTRSGLVSHLETALAGRKEIDADVLEELEYTLIGADIGIRTTSEILELIRQRVDRKSIDDVEELKLLIQSHLVEVLEATERPLPRVTEPPAVVLVVGVNGTGKTTTIGKLARLYRSQGHGVLLCAADTFRAAAIEQLQIWGERTGTEVIHQKPGADPSAVLFDALQSGRSHKIDYVIVDTAGRLHTKSNLMAELDKMRRTAARLIPGAPHEVLLVHGRHHRPERPGAGPPLHGNLGCDGHRAHQARRHRQGRRGGSHRARAEPAHPLRGRRREARRPAALRGGQVRVILV